MTETVEEFLKRGGKITVLEPGESGLAPDGISTGRRQEGLHHAKHSQEPNERRRKKKLKSENENAPC